MVSPQPKGVSLDGRLHSIRRIWRSSHPVSSEGFAGHYHDLDNGDIGHVIVGKCGSFVTPLVAMTAREPLVHDLLPEALDSIFQAVWLYQLQGIAEANMAL